MWREHVLYTAVYSEQCNLLAGRMVHHNPDADAEPKERARRAYRTLGAYRRHFDAPPSALWDFCGVVPLSDAEKASLDAPAPKRARAASSSTMSIAVQAPCLPLRTMQMRADDLVQSLFSSFAAEAGSQHLMVGRNAVPPTTRLRFGTQWLHDLQVLGELGINDGGVIYVATPRERRSRDELAITINDIAAGALRASRRPRHRALLSGPDPPAPAHRLTRAPRRRPCHPQAPPRVTGRAQQSSSGRRTPCSTS